MIALYFGLEVCTTMMVAHVHDWTRWLDILAISISTFLLLAELRYKLDPHSNLDRVLHHFKRLKWRN